MAVGAVAAVLATTACAEDADAQDATVEDFYVGETIELVVPYGPGGGADILSQFLARHLPEHIPGNPAVRVIYEEGAGGVTGTNNYVLNRDPDGMSIIYYTMSNSIPVMLGQSAVQYTHEDFTPLIGLAQGSVVFAHDNSGVESVEDLLSPDEPLVNALRTVTGYDLLQVLALDVLGIRDDVQQVFGYDGGGAQRLAWETGESNFLMMGTFGYSEQYAGDEAAGQVHRIFTYPIAQPDGTLAGDPIFPELPTLGEAHEILYGTEPSGPAWEAFVALLTATTFNRLVVHQDAPDVAKEALRQGFESLAADESVLTELQELIGPYDPLVGQDLADLTASMENIDESSLQWMRDLLVDEYEVVLD